MESLTGGCWGHLWGKTPGVHGSSPSGSVRPREGKAVSISYCLLHYESAHTSSY